MYANNAVPASLKYPHDRVGNDHDSIGLFQQRYMYYKNVAADMDVPTLCQKVQRSAPDAYSGQLALAKKICSADGD
jgi:hypothetical protein